MMNFKAIQSLRPNAEFTMNGDNLNTIIWHTQGVITPTVEEITAEITRLEAADIDAVQAKESARQSALAKLTAIGLSEEEIAALQN
jgi:DNA-binding NarL/FixJ family response regulator